MTVLIVAESVSRVKALAAARRLRRSEYAYATPRSTSGVRGYTCTELIADLPEAQWSEPMRSAILPAFLNFRWTRRDD